MIQLPEKMRKTLERLVNDLKSRVDVYGVGLYGSWSRGDAATSSDVDLFVLNKSDLGYEYVERLEKSGLFIDLDFVPRKWFYGPIPPETDQKLQEMQILYDRDWLLTNTKLMMAKSYSTPERVDIRTEDHILSSDIYLSRATSAFSREDYLSAYIFTTVSLENTLRILAEIAMESFSNSHFTERMEHAAVKLGMHEMFQRYLEISKLNEADDSGIRNKLRLFEATWEEINITAKRSLNKATTTHFKVLTNLNYYLNPAFLQGVMTRTASIVDDRQTIEASHYLNNILLDIVENYVWLRSSSSNIRIDYTTLMRSLRTLEQKNPKTYDQIAALISPRNIGRTEANDAIRKTREIALNIRKNRRILAKNHSGKT